MSGIKSDQLPSLEQVERRRFELWLVSSALLVTLSGGVAVLSLWSAEDLHRLLVQPAVRFGLLGLTLALSAYTIEKERHLRRVSRLLLDERLLSTALANRLHEIGALLEAGRAVNSTLELDRVLASILAGATDLLPASSGSVMLLEGDALVVAAAAGNDGALGRRAALGDGIAGHVARSREALLVDGRATSAVFPGYVPRDGAAHSSLCVPLVERDELLGVLNLSAPSEGAFSEYDLRAVSVFAEQAATAIAKARLYERSRRQAEELAHAATHDPLTGLANRVALDERATESGGSETLLFLDLDGFKAVNDRLGHTAGDAVLVQVAERLRESLRPGDLVARFGGDEFAVLLGGPPDRLLAAQLASRLVRALAAPLPLGGVGIGITASIGVAVPDGGTDHDELLQQADRALYAAKGAGKGCWRVYEPELVGTLPGPRSAAGPDAGVQAP